MKKEPKDLIQYHFEVMGDFYNFIQTEDEEVLMDKLYSIERHWKSWNAIQKTNKDMWFRFFKNDTAATTIADIQRDLHSPNRKYRMDNMKICYDTGEIEVYFS